MELEKIGFYTLDDERVKRVIKEEHKSPLHRCELILTDRCNFKCPYCRGMKDGDKGDLSYSDACDIVLKWAKEGLKNVRFSGGEPTIWPRLPDLVRFTKSLGVERIALSTNGSADFWDYLHLFYSGVNDFSISLDACCSSTADKMAGIEGAYERVVNNIKYLSNLTYVTVGVVLTKENIEEVNKIVEMASGLGVADIRLISAAQWNSDDIKRIKISDEILAKHPILKYRINNFKNNVNVRGIQENDCHRCSLVLDDMAVLNGKHYPCIIYMREHGEPIGRMSGDFRKDRQRWFLMHDSSKDPICKKNCLDVCIDYNNRFRDFASE